MNKWQIQNKGESPVFVPISHGQATRFPIANIKGKLQISGI